MRNRLICLGLIGLLSPICFANCFVDAGQTYRVDPLLLKAIAIQESHLNPYAFNGHNANQTYDIGLMQINSSHFKKLARYHIEPRRLYSDPCLSVHVAAWILAGNFYHHGYNWNSVGGYNAGFADKRQRQRTYYANKIKKIYFSLKQQNKRQ